jgi:hypothetical protein
MNIAWHLGLFAFVLMALAGANLDIPEPYRTWIAIQRLSGEVPPRSDVTRQA